MWASFDVLKVWREKAFEAEGSAFDCGHFLPEEAPERTALELIRFLSSIG